MPALSSTMTEGKVVQWLKGEGEKVERGESIVVVESDKADMDVESFHSGYVALLASDGGVATFGIGAFARQLQQSAGDGSMTLFLGPRDKRIDRGDGLQFGAERWRQSWPVKTQ